MEPHFIKDVWIDTLLQFGRRKLQYCGMEQWQLAWFIPKRPQVRVLLPLHKTVIIMEKNTIESKVASAILQREAGRFEIDGREYALSDPNIATLILVSEIIATLPVVERVPADLRVYASLHYAKDYKAIGDICAILILGAKGLTEEREIIEEKRILGVFRRRKVRRVMVDRKAELSRLILENLSPSFIMDMIIQRLKDMEVGTFFLITTSLNEANVLKPTKEVEH